MTVIQKLARCSMEQAGKPCDLSAFDPQTGASLVATTSTLSQSTVSLATSPSSLTSVNKCGLKEITGSSTGACPDTGKLTTVVQLLLSIKVKFQVVF